MSPSTREPRWHGLGVALIAIAVVACLAWLFGPDTSDRRRALALAVGTCLVGHVGAWCVGRWPAETAAARAALPLAATAVRLTPALAALGWLQAGGRGLRAAGAGEVLVALYLAALGAEVVRVMIEGRKSVPRPRGDDGV